MSWENFKFGAKDVISALFYVITATIFVSSILNKVEALTVAVNDIKSERKEAYTDDKAIKQNMQNQINANSLQIQLMKQDIEMIKQGYYSPKK